jgi:dihydropteroate synthase
MSAMERKIWTWKLGGRELELGRRTLVMGIVNATPDSFSDGGRYFSPEAAVEHALRLLDEGADLIDLGGESTRPGAQAGSADAVVSAAEEQARVLPVIVAILRERPATLISVDTYKAATARAAVEAGARIVNDVSGLAWDRQMAAVCAEAGCGLVLMHTRGRPEEWRGLERLSSDAMVQMVRQGLNASLQQAEAAGIALDSIVLDPGYGFGKNFEENFLLLARQQELLELGRPLLVGLSRKSFLGRVLAPLYAGQDAPAGRRDPASAAAAVAAVLHGAAIVRTHEVRATAEAVRVADAVAEMGARIGTDLSS